MIYVFLAEGFEETEAIAPIDLLRRSGRNVITVGVGNKTIKGSHGIPVTADITAEEISLNDELEMIVLPGGMPGTINLEKSEYVQSAIDYCVKNRKFIGAICAARFAMRDLSLSLRVRLSAILPLQRTISMLLLAEQVLL